MAAKRAAQRRAVLAAHNREVQAFVADVRNLPNGEAILNIFRRFKYVCITAVA